MTKLIKLKTKVCFKNDIEMQGSNCNWSKGKKKE